MWLTSLWLFHVGLINDKRSNITHPRLFPDLFLLCRTYNGNEKRFYKHHREDLHNLEVNYKVLNFYLPLDYNALTTRPRPVDNRPQSGQKNTLNNSVVVVGGSLHSCWWFLGGHVVRTAGGAQIRDGLGGTEGGGAPGVWKGPVFQKTPPAFQQ